MKGQFFNEIYGNYYNTMALVIEAARNGKLDGDSLYEIVKENAFAESVVPITDAVMEERWLLVNSSFRTNIKHKPEMPLTNLQMRFLKSMILDHRAKFFFDDETLSELRRDLEKAELLYNSSDVEYFDRCFGESDCENPDCIRNFRKSLKSVLEDERGKNLLEYSPISGSFKLRDATAGEKTTLVLEITDERDTLDRALIHFSHLEKSCSKIDKDKYRLTLNFESGDASQMANRVLYFGPYVKAVEPGWFVEMIRERLRKQKIQERTSTPIPRLARSYGF